MRKSSVKAGCEECRYKNKFEFIEKDKYGEKKWECKKGGTTVYSKGGLEDAIFGNTGCGAEWVHNETGETHNEYFDQRKGGYWK
ncbi:MAG: hypothetical protein KKA79_02740 [Nanoarchaeota archaeon]|nr:hypothetical protein [Nanoarchaeota archaeon]MCG2718645.1 hypothetical protein [Nanoarchaeota archaeon]